MALTTRKDILDDLVYRLGLVMAFGVRLNVYRQRDTEAEPFESSELPALNCRDQQVDITHWVSYDEHQMPVTITLHTTSRINTDQAEDIKAALLATIALAESTDALNELVASDETDPEIITAYQLRALELEEEDINNG